MKKGSLVFVGLLILLAMFFVSCDNPLDSNIVTKSQGDAVVEAGWVVRNDAKPVAYARNLPAAITLPAIGYPGADGQFAINLKLTAGDTTAAQRAVAVYTAGFTQTLTHNDGVKKSTAAQEIDVEVSRFSENILNYRTYTATQNPASYFTQTFSHDDLSVSPVTYYPWQEAFFSGGIDVGTINFLNRPTFYNSNWVHGRIVTQTVNATTIDRADLSGYYHADSIAYRARSLKEASLQVSIANYNYMMARNEDSTIAKSRTTAITYVDDIDLTIPTVLSDTTADPDYFWKYSGNISDATTWEFTLRVGRQLIGPQLVNDNGTTRYAPVYSSQSNIPSTLTPANFRIWDASTGAQLGSVPANGTFKVVDVIAGTLRTTGFPATIGGIYYDGQSTDITTSRYFTVKLQDVTSNRYTIGGTPYRCATDVIVQIVDVPGVSPVPFLVSVPAWW